ncbi:MAG: PilN domain-containing protein [Granulosicoccaceae bacterium]|jgi:type IV pilus assembly protein PilN
MARINLLPWREELRKERQQQFMVILGLCAGLALAVIALVHINVAGIIDNQLSRNKYMEGEIKKLDARIKEIEDLEKEKARLLARMNVIQQLQGSRPQVVHVFDELVATLPDGVYLTSIKNTGNTIELSGFAQSNARVSSYMRNVDNADWLSDPRLNVIETKDQDGRRISQFVLNAKTSSPASQEGEDKL